MTVGDAAEPGAAAFVETPFLGVRLARLDMQEAARVIAARPFGAPFAYVVTPNVCSTGATTSDSAPPTRMPGCDCATARWCVPWLGTVRRASPACRGQRSDGISVRTLHSAGRSHHDHRRRGGIGDAVANAVPPDEPAAPQPAHGLHQQSASDRPLHRIRARPPGAVCLSRGRCSFSEILAHRIAAGRGAIGTGLCIGSSLRFLVRMAKRAPDFSVWPGSSGCIV